MEELNEKGVEGSAEEVGEALAMAQGGRVREDMGINHGADRVQNGEQTVRRGRAKEVDRAACGA